MERNFLIVSVIVVGIAGSLFGGTYSGGSGTAGDPYRISDANDLVDLSNTTEDWGKHFVLVNDIDMEGVSITQIGYDYQVGGSFDGIFDGGGYVIWNLSIIVPDKDYIGLFGRIGLEGEVRNLGLEQANISGWEYVGCLAGGNYGRITNCYAMGFVRGYIRVGGLLGFNYGRVKNCHSVTSTSGKDYIGGLTGSNHGDILNCFSKGSASPESERPADIGGLVSSNSGTITNCFSKVLVNGNYMSGGVVASNRGDGAIINCYSTGDVRGKIYAGGLVGWAPEGNIINCYSTGSVSGEKHLGGLLGKNSGVSISNSYFLETSGPANGSGVGLSEAEMREQMNFVGWDFIYEGVDGNDDVWTIEEGVAYPRLYWESSLLISDGSFEFGRLENGGNGDGQVLWVTNITSEPISWEIFSHEVCEWLEIEPMSGTVGAGEIGSIVLGVNSYRLDAGDYSCEFILSDMALQKRREVHVSLDVVGPLLEVSKGQFVFSGLEDGELPSGQLLTITNSGGGILEWMVEDDSVCEWIVVSPQSGVIGAGASETISLGVRVEGLSHGWHDCELLFSGSDVENSPVAVKVRLQISSINPILVPSDYSTIQGAIDAAVDGDVVVVADGVYLGIGNRGIDFMGKAITVRSENGAESCIIDCENKGRGFYFHSGEGIDSVLDGFTIRKGNKELGGGIRCYDSGPVIQNCIIRENKAYSYSTRYFYDDYSYYLTEWNEGGSGGGIYGSSGAIVNCLITDNRSFGEGGGLSKCSGPIINCTITHNYSQGLHWQWLGITETHGLGAGLFDCDGDIIGCSISYNLSGGNGGGLIGCDGSIRNCLIIGNTADDGAVLSNCDGIISNCTIVGNIVDGFEPDGSIYGCFSLVNCIIRDNSYFNPAYNGEITYSNVEGGCPGEGNIDVEPLFADAGGGDYHLKSEAGRWDPNSLRWVYDDVTSGCIDGGDPGSDWGGEYWPHGGRINIGAYGGTRYASMSLNGVGSVGDLDYDLRVGFLDFGVLGDQWGCQSNAQGALNPPHFRAGANGPPYRGDLDRDGVVGFGDLVLFAEEWLLD